jgi:DNA mismatch repair protein MLH1
MLHEYFSIQIDLEGRLVTLPSLLPNHVPDLDALPSFLLRIGTEVNWLEEEPCFHGIALELSRFYSSCPSCELSDHGAVSDSYARAVQHVLFPCMKQMLIPSSVMGSDGSLVEVLVF